MGRLNELNAIERQTVLGQAALSLTPGLDQIARRATGCTDTGEAWERLAAWWRELHAKTDRTVPVPPNESLP